MNLAHDNVTWVQMTFPRFILVTHFPPASKINRERMLLLTGRIRAELRVFKNKKAQTPKQLNWRKRISRFVSRLWVTWGDLYQWGSSCSKQLTLIPKSLERAGPRAMTLPTRYIFGHLANVIQINLQGKQQSHTPAPADDTARKPDVRSTTSRVETARKHFQIMTVITKHSSK